MKATVAQQPEEMGYQVVMNAYKAIKGEQVERTVFAPVVVINKDNCDQY